MNCPVCHEQLGHNDSCSQVNAHLLLKIVQDSKAVERYNEIARYKNRGKVERGE